MSNEVSTKFLDCNEVFGNLKRGSWNDKLNEQFRNCGQAIPKGSKLVHRGLIKKDLAIETFLKDDGRFHTNLIADVDGEGDLYYFENCTIGGSPIITKSLENRDDAISKIKI